ncbi:MAG: DUF951 family protein [Lactobacillales bacterium]|jgi:hypothetical protein|nr:DUF951 family protein [Lactobacillales bacterium]
MYDLGNFIELKKPHACMVKKTDKKANCWKIIRMGADIKIECTNCSRIVMMTRRDFEKRLKKISPRKEE